MRFIIILAALASLVSGCGGSSQNVASDPILTVNPNGVTPLAAIVEMETSDPVSVILTVSDQNETKEISFLTMNTTHKLPVLGLKSNTAYTVKVETVEASGRVSDVTQKSGGLNFVTEPLPDDFPAIDVLVSKPDQMEPGYILLDKFARAANADPDLGLYCMILDPTGDVTWYSTLCERAIRQLPNGNLFYRDSTDTSDFLEIDFLGNIVNVVKHDVLQLHHDVFPTAHGTYLSLSRESRTVSNYPSSDTDPDAPPMVAAVENSPVVEIDASGNLINQWGPVDMVDQLRIGYFSLRDGKVGLDWGHANAVFHNPADDSIIVSLRHQSAVIKFSRATGELIWILGDHSQWGDEYGQYLLTPVGLPFEWQYYQHAPMVTASGTLMLHDNGNFRTIPFDGKFPMVGIQSYSRAVEYEIDEQRMEVHQVWEYGASASPRLYASFIGDADSLPITRNTLINFGGVTFIDGVDVADLNLGSHVVRVIEVNHETPADKVFEVMLHDLAGGRVIAYRSEKLTGLYPNDVTVNLVE